MPRGRRGQITIKQKPTGLFYADIRLGRDPATGVPVRKTVYGATADAVQDQLVTLQHEQRRGVPVDIGRQRLDAYLADWLEHSVAPRRRPDTIERYRRAIDHHITPYLGHIRLTLLKPEHVERLLTALLTTGRLPRHAKEVEKMPAGLAPASVLLVRAVLRRALGQAVRRGHLARNVAALIDPPPATSPEALVLDDDQARALIAAATGTRLEGIVTIALGLGLRQAEALGLTWDDVDLDAGVVHVRRQLKGSGGVWRLDELKTPSSRRDLPLPAVVVATLRQHRSRQAQARLLAGRDWRGSPWPLVFPSSVGTPWTARNLTRAFKTLLARAELPTELHWHELRHSAGSLLHARGVELATIKAILGHSQIAVTANRYTHVATATTRQAAHVMDAALRPSERSGGMSGGMTELRKSKFPVGPAGFEPATSEL
jgi:integrase